MDISDLDAPQYVDFEAEFLGNTNSFDGTESPQNAACKHEESSDMGDEVNDSNLQESQSSFTDSLMVNHEVYSEDSIDQNESRDNENAMEHFSVHQLKSSPFPVNAVNKQKQVNKVTKVKPFHFRTEAKAAAAAEEKKRKREDEYKTLAEQVAAFQQKTPQRFRGVKGEYQPPEHWSPHLVQPKSPNLRATKRSRVVTALSREQEEEMLIKKMKKHKFRARPYNPNKLHKTQETKTEKRIVTKPKEFNLKTDQRAIEHLAKKKEEEEPFEFHARPVPKAILEGPVGIKEKPILPVTQPKTPKLALKQRSEQWLKNKERDQSTEIPVFKAAPAPKPAAPLIVKHEIKKTEVQPFSFDAKDKERMMLKEKKIQEEIEKENTPYIFKAQAMPNPEPAHLPAVPKMPVTQPKPFNFQLEIRSSKHSSFDASADTLCSSLRTLPDKQKKTKDPLSKEPKEFQLQTDIRAIARQQWQKEQEKKMKEQEELLLQQQALNEELEKEEIKKLRKNLVHKANPVRQYKPVNVVKNVLPLTQPVSPKFKTEERLQLKHSKDFEQ